MEDNIAWAGCHDLDMRYSSDYHISVTNNALTYRLAPDSCSYQELTITNSVTKVRGVNSREVFDAQSRF